MGDLRVGSLLLVAFVLKILYCNRSLFTIQSPQNKQMWGLVGIPQGQRWCVCAATGQLSTVVGPKVIWVCGSTLTCLKPVQATQAEYLRVDFVDGRSEIVPGPSVIH